MPKEKQLKGKCTYCGQEVMKNTVAKHLQTCPQRQELITKSEQKKGNGSETLYHLRVEDAYGGDFWLDLEMRGSASLRDLDKYLRAIWLECCGHMSQFSIGGWQGDKISMGRRICEVFQPGIKLTHIYDFGTESQTLIKAIGIREGVPTTRHPIVLMVRNLLPEAKCIKCKKPATKLCIECLNDHEVWGTLCDEHAQSHPHDNYGEPMALVNSPRLGMCGYDGPAEPPY